MTNNIRISLGIVLFAAVVFAPPWAVALVAIALAARWRAWEIIAAGMLMDFLWLPTSIPFLSLQAVPYATIFAIAIFMIFEPLRRQLLVGPSILE